MLKKAVDEIRKSYGKPMERTSLHAQATQLALRQIELLEEIRDYLKPESAEPELVDPPAITTTPAVRPEVKPKPKPKAKKKAKKKPAKK